MKKSTYNIVIALAMTVVTASLSGCGSTGSSIESQAAKADVTISARFPSSGGASKSLVPAGTGVIEVSGYQPGTQTQPVLLATLTPSAATKTIKMAPGMYSIYAEAYDSADSATRKMLGQTSTGGEVKVGVANNVNLTFLDGQWTIVNASDIPTPLVLSDGTQLIDFIVGGDGQPLYKAGKSSIDYSKPVGGGGGSVRLRFDNNTSARTEGWMASQFVGATNGTFLESDSYNLTKKCGYYNYYGLPCEEVAGDQIVMISSKDTGGAYQGSYPGDTMLYGSADTLLPAGGKTTFTQNGTAFDLMSAIPDTTVTGGNLITGGIIEWKPSTNRITTLGTPALAVKRAKTAKAVKAVSANTAYTGLAVKDVETIVCSGTNPQNRGTWTFANNSSAGKVVLGNRVCYTNYPSLNSQYDPILMQSTVNAGDYTYGLVPADTANLGDYCHEWDYTNNTCLKQLPGNGAIYNPYNFRAVKSATKTTINYGSFKLIFWGESTQTGTAYVYPLRAKGSTAIKTAPAAPVINSISVPTSVQTGTASVTLSALASDPNGDLITWSWSVVSGGGTLGAGCSGSGTATVNSSCTYNLPSTNGSVVLKFSASDGAKSSELNRTLSISDAISATRSIIESGMFEFNSNWTGTSNFYYIQKIYLPASGSNLAESITSYLDPVSKMWSATAPANFPPQQGDYVLTATGWQMNVDMPSSYTMAFNTDGSATISNAVSGESAQMTLTAVDVSGQAIPQVGFPLLSGAGAFPAGSLRYDMTWNTLVGSYALWDSWGNSLGTDLTLIPGQFPTSSQYNSMYIDSNGANQYYGQFIGGASNVVNIYQMGTTTTTPTLVGTATYSIVTVLGKQILEVAIPAALRTQYSLGNNPIFAVAPTGYIYRGEHSLPGISFSNGQGGYNQTAINHIQNNIDTALAKAVVAKKLSKAVLGF